MWHCNQTCPNLKLLLFDSQYAKRPVITKLSLPIHFKVQSSTECPCLMSIGLHLYRFSLSRDTKDDHVKLWKGFQTKVLLYRAWVTGATMKQLMNKNIRSQEIQPTLNLVFNHFFFLNLDLAFFKLKNKIL